MTHPTIRELLERALQYQKDESPHLLAERVEAVLKIHRIGKIRCVADGLPWPCPTIRALNGEKP